MNSIRRRLLHGLLLGIALSSALTGVLVYRHVRGELDELYNAHLQQLAGLLVAQLDGRAPPAARTPAVGTAPAWSEEHYLIQTWERSGRLLDASVPVAGLDAASVPLQAAPGLHVRRLDHESWRIFRADGEHLLVQVAQPEHARRGAIGETSLSILLPLLLQMPLLVLLALGAVRRGLRPLDRLQRAIAQRQPEALTPLDSAAVAAELQPLVRTLNALLARLDRALQQQRHFVADAAHELRTPIAALQLQLDLLARAPGAAERERAQAELGRGIRRATELIGQLLAIARAEAPPAAAPDCLALPACASAALERHLPTARARDIDLGVTRLEALHIRCAPAALDTVLDNLLGNAIRYTPPGGRIDLAIYRDGAHAAIEVCDTGIGIPAAERQRIFDRFYRVLEGNAGEGSGLGLAITKSLCERHGAEIAVTANPAGQGSCFRVSWPLAAPPG